MGQDRIIAIALTIIGAVVLFLMATRNDDEYLIQQCRDSGGEPQVYVRLSDMHQSLKECVK
jgi:hypothetical protein